MKKIASFLLATSLMACCVSASFVAGISSAPEANVCVLEGAVGEVIEGNGVKFERLPDDFVIPEGSQTRSSQSPWQVTFNGEKNYSKMIDLSKRERFWKVYIQNKGTSDIVCTVSQIPCTVPAGRTWNFYSTEQWDVGSYTCDFSGNPLKGSAALRIASTYDELLIN